MVIGTAVTIYWYILLKYIKHIGGISDVTLAFLILVGLLFTVVLLSDIIYTALTLMLYKKDD